MEYNSCDRRNVGIQEIPECRFMPLMNTSFEPGHCVETIEKMEAGPKKDIAWAEYYYFSGNAAKAMQTSEIHISSLEEEYRLSACWIFAYSCLSMGKIESACHALQEIKDILMKARKSDAPITSIEGFVASAASLLLHLPLPEGLPPLEKIIPSLPAGLRAYGLYVQAHYLYLKGEYAQSAGLVEGALAMGALAFPIPAIYLHLAAVMDYMSMKNKDRAESHLLMAWNTASRDNLIEAFGEHHGLLGATLESVIKPNWPKDFKKIIDITYHFSAGWRRVHNPATGEDIADNLTTTEFSIAMLAARGWTNGEIAEHMNISSNTVKTHISDVMRKLDVPNRKALKKYMLK